MTKRTVLIAGVSLWICLQYAAAQTRSESDNGFGLTFYSRDMNCGQITSGFGSVIDLDGTRRDQPHTGIDFGNLGDRVIAPADGTVRAIWRVTHDWGTDWNLLLTHTTSQLNFPARQVVYYTEFDHLQIADLSHLKVGNRVTRGSRIGTVRHPGNNPRFRAETHMEVYKIPLGKQNATHWRTNNGRKYWFNPYAILLDPEYMLTRHEHAHPPGKTKIVLFDKRAEMDKFAGFTYPIQCLDN